MVLQVGISRLRGERVHQLSPGVACNDFLDGSGHLVRSAPKSHPAPNSCRTVMPQLASPLSIFSSPQHLRPFSLTRRVAKPILARTPRAPLTYLLSGTCWISQRGAKVVTQIPHLLSRDASAVSAGPHRSSEEAAPPEAAERREKRLPGAPESRAAGGRHAGAPTSLQGPYR